MVDKEIASAFAAQLSVLTNTPEEVLFGPATNLLKEISGPAMRGVSIVGRDAGYVRPFMDICLIWDSGLAQDVSGEKGPLYSPLQALDRFAEKMEPYVDMLVGTVDIKNSSIELFQQGSLKRIEESRGRQTLLLAATF